MAVIENKATEIGDVLIIKTEVPIIGIVTLLSFVDDTDGEVVNKYFQKTFRYSVDGINFSPYLALSTANVQGIVINPTDSLVIEYIYQRSGLDNSGSLIWNSTTLDGEFIEVVCGEAYEKSMYSDYFGCNNICSLNWSINVLEKLYQGGLLASYIERGSSSSNAEDRDFIDFWRSVTHFFALFVCLARAFAEFYSDEGLLKCYLQQRCLFFCEDTDYQELYYLMQNYHDEIRQRGTRWIIKEKNAFEFISDCPDESESVSISASASISGSAVEEKSLKYIDGELLRLICYDILDEFMFCLSKAEKLGWNIGNSSPLYGGMSNQNCVNKAYEDSRDIKDLSLYPLINPDKAVVVNDGGKQVMHLANVPSGEVAGIGALDFAKALKVDPQLDYEITFVVRQDSDISESASFSDSNNDGVQDGNLTFGCFAFNSFGGLEILQNIQDGSNEDLFFQRVNLQRDDKYIYIRGIIFNYNKYPVFSPLSFYKKGKIVSLGNVYYRVIKDNILGITPGTTPISFTYFTPIPINELNPTLKNSLNIGQNLKFKDNVNYIMPYIVLDNEKGLGGELFIWDVKVKPVSTPYSHGFIQQPNFIHIWMKNRNGKHSDEQIRQNMRKFLLPYDCTFNNIVLQPSAAELEAANLGEYNDDFNDDFNT